MENNENKQQENVQSNDPVTNQEQTNINNGQKTGNNTPQVLGIIGLVFGIIALLISFIPCLGLYAIFPGVLAIVLSVVGLVLANKNNQQNKGLIIAALVISIIATIVSGYQYYVLSRTASNLQDVTKGMEEFSNQIDKAMDDNIDSDDTYNDQADNDESDEEVNDENNSTELGSEIDKLVQEKDYDKIIDYFDKYATEYVELTKKAQNGDFGAAAKAMASAAKLGVITTKVAIISPYLDEDQQKRLDEINDKLDKISKK